MKMKKLLALLLALVLVVGMVPLAAYNYAAGNLRRMDEVLRFTRRVGIAIAVVSIVLYELFAPQLLRVFLEAGALPNASTSTKE